ncbi:MAG: (2Fe-2S) ferredoxin domain-containing protein [Tatlockia sp.]|nr:(2Fe-2S) ferredoxin domain-containing protein [Tatlockia sp.]
MSHYTNHLFLCVNQKTAGKQCCSNTGGEPFFDYMKGKLLELDLHGPGKIKISKSGCLGRCSKGPCIVIYPEGVWYNYATLADIDEIISTHLIAGNRVNRLLITD